MMGSSDFYSLSPFEQAAFEGVPGIPAEQLYKMAGKTQTKQTRYISRQLLTVNLA
jgi:hypothetical protein